MSKLILGIWKSCVHKCDSEGVFLLLVWEEMVEQEELRERANKAIRRVSDVIGAFSRRCWLCQLFASKERAGGARNQVLPQISTLIRSLGNSIMIDNWLASPPRGSMPFESSPGYYLHRSIIP